MSTTVIEGDVIIRGQLTTTSKITDQGASANPYPTANLQHRYHAKWGQSGSAASETRTIFVCKGATGTVIGFSAGSIAIAVGAATVTIDLKKNGSTILSAVITLDTANTARIMEAATLSAAGLVANDWLEIVVVATAGGGTLPTGLYVEAIIDELPA